MTNSFLSDSFTKDYVRKRHNMKRLHSKTNLFINKLEDDRKWYQIVKDYVDELFDIFNIPNSSLVPFKHMNTYAKHLYDDLFYQRIVVDNILDISKGTKVVEIQQEGHSTIENSVILFNLLAKYGSPPTGLNLVGYSEVSEHKQRSLITLNHLMARKFRTSSSLVIVEYDKKTYLM